MKLYILGRQPALGLAELERVCGEENVASFGGFAATVHKNTPDFARLGGSLKCVEIVQEIPYKNHGHLNTFLIKNAETLFAPGPKNRHTLGLSIYGADMPAKKINALLLGIKKQLRTSERSIRIVEHKLDHKTPFQKVRPSKKAFYSSEKDGPSKSISEAGFYGVVLESASVIHNGLLQENGRELVVAVDGKRALIGLTTHEQDIESYTVRDRGRPKRDSKVGMLPPKLAQIIINVAAGPLAPNFEHIILDPFCGTGVILQEAGLMGYGAYGTDIEPRMVEFSQQNAAWAAETFAIRPASLQVGDATSFQWQPGFSAVAAEAYLGVPLTSTPSREKIQPIIQNCNTVLSKFLQNLSAQTPHGMTMCLAVPAWQTSPGTFTHLPLIDDLTDLGYNRVDFKHVRTNDLIYFRKDQIVARELLVLTRK